MPERRTFTPETAHHLERFSVAECPDRYVIGRPIEETECDWCGAPLYVGDTAIETSCGIYCSRVCASKVAS